MVLYECGYKKPQSMYFVRGIDGSHKEKTLGKQHVLYKQRSECALDLNKSHCWRKHFAGIGSWPIAFRQVEYVRKCVRNFKLEIISIEWDFFDLLLIRRDREKKREGECESWAHLKCENSTICLSNKIRNMFDLNETQICSTQCIQSHLR